jgi:lysophospholipase L1-like esterase
VGAAAVPLPGEARTSPTDATALSAAVAPGAAGAGVTPYRLPKALRDDRGEQLVVLFGDSLTVLSAPRTLQLFADDPDLQLSASYFGGTTFDTAAWVEGYTQVPEGSVVMLMLGINDLIGGSEPAVAAHAAAAVDSATAAGARRVILATVGTTGWTPTLGYGWGDKVNTYNDWLRKAAADDTRFPTLEVADWDRLSWGHTDYLQPDAIHLTPSGQAAYAALIHDAAA